MLTPDPQTLHPPPGAAVPGRSRFGAQKVIILLALAFFIVWGAALITFLRKPQVLAFEFPVLERHPAGVHNLAFYRYGTAVRASSYDHWSDSQHHPGFLVDGLKEESLQQKWVSRASDLLPWVELRWNKPAALERVVIRHAGVRENKYYTSHHYKITCLRDPAAGSDPTLEVKDNELDVATHAITCAHSLGVRLNFWPNGPSDVARVFEIQALGALEKTK